MVMARPRILLAALLLLAGSTTASADCGDSVVALQVLGSGGPFGVGRASAGYIVWIDGVSRIMVDAGGGTFVRFHEAGAKVSDLRLLALSHFHPDHSSEVPGLLWAQASDLRIAGPSGNEGFPSIDQFLFALFESPNGAFRVIGQYLDADTVSVDVSAPEAVEVYSDGLVTVRGIGVPHGNVPTVGFRVDVGDASVAFSSDQTGTNPAFLELIRDVDVLVVHFAASEEPVGASATLHATPSVWGRLASDARVGALVLSHLSKAEPAHPSYTSQSGSDLEGSVAHLRSHYGGRLIVAEDLLCVTVE
jgi:ribonuclease BN (tRNA processing enzyme)